MHLGIFAANFVQNLNVIVINNAVALIISYNLNRYHNQDNYVKTGCSLKCLLFVSISCSLLDK